MNKSPSTLYKPSPAVKKVDTSKTEQNKNIKGEIVVNKVMRHVNVGQELKKLVRTPLLTKPRLSLANLTVRIRTKITVRILSCLVIKRIEAEKGIKVGKLPKLHGYVPTPEEEDEDKGFQWGLEF